MGFNSGFKGLIRIRGNRHRRIFESWRQTQRSIAARPLWHGENENHSCRRFGSSRPLKRKLRKLCIF